MTEPMDVMMGVALTESGIKRLWLNEDFRLLMNEMEKIRKRHNDNILNVQLSDVDYAFHRGAVNTIAEVINIINSYEE